MPGFIPLILSIILVASSSYFITAHFQSKRGENTFLFWILIVISQIILSFEMLSLIKQINQPVFLITNLIVFITAFWAWNRNDMPKINMSWIKNHAKKIKTALKRDKYLLIISIFFIFAFLTTLFLAVFAPINVWDAMSYQVARIAFWIQHGTLAHFETSSVRQIIFPPNSELLMLWIMLFIKKDFFLGTIQYLACFASMFTAYNFLSYLKVSTSRTLWAILVFASFPAVIIHSSGTQNHIILGFLLLTSLYLFIYGVFKKEKLSIFFSALALGISLGVKSSVFLFLPGIIIAYALISIKKQGKDFYKTGLLYFLYLVPVFILFSAYFYIMNYIEFGHPLGVKSYIYEHTFMGKGIEAFIANLIRYHTVFIDFTGFDTSWQTFLSFPVHLLRTVLFALLGISPNAGLTHSGDLANNLVLANTSTHENHAGLGPLGFLVMLPLLFLSTTKYIFSKSTRTYLIGISGFVFVVFLLTISTIMGYELWNNRYFITAAVISAPVLAFSYTPGNMLSIKKLVILAVCIFSFVKIPLFNELRPVFPVKNFSLLTHSREEIRYNTGSIFDNIFREPVVYLEKLAEKDSRIGLIFPDKFWYYHYFTDNPSWDIYPLNLEILTKKKLKSMDYLVIYGGAQELYSIKEHSNYNKMIKPDYNILLKYFDLEYSIKTEFDRDKYKHAELGQEFIFYIFKAKESNNY